MNAATLLSAALLSWGTPGVPVQASQTQSPPSIVPGYEIRQVVCYRPEWREEKVPCVVHRVDYRKEVTRVKTQVWVPKQFDEKVRIAYYVPVPKEVERDVYTCVMVPMMMVDPCTGCCFVSCYPSWVAQRVRCVEYDYRKEERNENVKVWRCVQQDTVVDQVRWIPVVTEEKSWTVRHYCVMVPHATAYYVPSCYVPCFP